MRILVTGGAGFIGSALVRQIIQNSNDTVVNVDKITYAGNLENLKEVEGSPKYFFEKVDICSQKELKQVFDKYQPHAVMHLAAESHVDRSIDGPAEFIETNIMGTYSLLSVALEYWRSLEQEAKDLFRFHHVSTDEVYGDLPHPDENPNAINLQFTEATSYAPSSPYSSSKASSDHLVRAWGKTYGLPVLITNCSNNYGPYHFPEKLVPHMIICALKGRPLTVYGEGDQIRDWLFVDDHVLALLKVLRNGVLGETYNIGGKSEKRNIEVVKTVCEILNDLVPPQGEKGVKKYEDLISYVEDRPGHDRRYAMDISKIEKELSWSPLETFESGMRKTVQWYLENKEWWQQILSGEYKLSRLGKGKMK